MREGRDTVRGQLLRALEEGYERHAWHGPTLKGSLRGVTAAAAAWRPARGRHNIWEVAVHAAYWKHAAIRRITGERRAFGEAGSNWFVRPPQRRTDAAWPRAWAEDLARLDATHRQLCALVAALPDAALTRKNIAGRETTDRTIRGIAAHDVYHAGQIQLLKGMRPD